jgi:hypothetical protein
MKKYILPEKLYLPILTFENISSSFPPLKGGVPLNKIYNITPILHKSHFSVYSPAKTSGAT